MLASLNWRLKSLENLNECAANLFLNFNIDFDKAMAMRRSDIKTIFESKQFKDWKRSREAQNRQHLAVCERIDNVVRSLANLGKVVAQKRSF
jgi:hypothetical protein